MGGPEGGLDILTQFQKSPPPGGEEEALRTASNLVGMAYGRVAPRSAEAAGKLAHALQDIQAARKALEKEPNQPMAAPPDLGLSGMGAPPTAPMPGM